MTKYLNQGKMKSHGYKSVGGEKLKAITLVTVTIISIIIVASAFAVNTELSRNPSGNSNTIPVTNSTSNQPFATLVGNLSNPHPYYNSTYGYVTPNLWDFVNGGGSVVMHLYNNSSIKMQANLYNAGSGIDIFAYSSVHLTHDLPITLPTAYKENLSSFVSFDIKNMSSSVRNDVAYDMFLGTNVTLEYEVEIMLLDDLAGNAYSGQNESFSGVVTTIPVQVNNITENVVWNLYVGNSASGTFPSYVLVPTIPISNSMNFEVNFVPFLSFLSSHSYISSNVSIVRLGIGTEYAISTLSHPYNFATYFLWIFSYFMLNGIKYQVIQPPPSSEAVQ
jgi:hypothetical protein